MRFFSGATTVIRDDGHGRSWNRVRGSTLVMGFPNPRQIRPGESSGRPDRRLLPPRTLEEGFRPGATRQSAHEFAETISKLAGRTRCGGRGTLGRAGLKRFLALVAAANSRHRHVWVFGLRLALVLGGTAERSWAPSLFIFQKFWLRTERFANEPGNNCCVDPTTPKTDCGPSSSSRDKSSGP